MVNDNVDRGFLPLAQNLSEQSSNVMGDTQENSEQYHSSHAMSTGNDPPIHLEQFLAPQTLGFSSNVPSTQIGYANSQDTLQTRHFQDVRPVIANTAPSSRTGYSLGQPPQVFDFGYGPGSDTSQSSQITGAVPWLYNTSSDRQLSLSQSQLDSIIQARLNEATSLMKQSIINDLQSRLPLNIPHISSNSPQFPTVQPSYSGSSQANMQLIENPTWNPEAQHPIHLGQRHVATSIELSDAMFGLTSISPITTSREIGDTNQSLQPRDGYDENGLGDLSNMFDSSND
jgi:hypothetical protein